MTVTEKALADALKDIGTALHIIGEIEEIENTLFDSHKILENIFNDPFS